jgi:DNA-binding NarL/FixJ family response regulator
MIAAFVDDLLFRSKIRAVASHTGAAVSFFRAADDPALAEAAIAIVDLDGPGAVSTVSALRAAWPSLRVLGFVSHVHAERIRDARAAGATDVMARSAFVNALPELLGADS